MTNQLPPRIIGYDHPEGPYVPSQPGMHTPPSGMGQYVKQEPKRKRGRIHWLFLPLAFILGIALGALTAPSGDAPSSTPNEQFTPGANKPGPSAKKWVPLSTLKGAADKSSDTIITTGGRIRVTYTFAATNDLVAGAIYFLKEGTDIQKDGAVPDVMVSEPGKDSTILRKAKGQYFLQVISSGATYTVTVEEEK